MNFSPIVSTERTHNNLTILASNQPLHKALKEGAFLALGDPDNLGTMDKMTDNDFGFWPFPA